MPSREVVALTTGFGTVNTERYWPMIVAALESEGIAQEPVQIAAAATLKAELGSNFSPRSEAYPSGVNPQDHFDKMYGPTTSVGKKLGNTTPGDGYRFRGRGFIQLTGRSNYAAYGRRLGLALETSPDLALDANNAARIFAAYFKDRGVAAAAMNADWRSVRILVNGGLNGWDRFLSVVTAIVKHASAAPGTALVQPPSTTDAAKPLLIVAGVTILALFARRWFIALLVVFVETPDKENACAPYSYSCYSPHRSEHKQRQVLIRNLAPLTEAATLSVCENTLTCASHHSEKQSQRKMLRVRLP